MKRFFSIVISLTILVNSLQINIYGLSRIDDLLEHLQYHNQKYGDDLFTFLSKHYGLREAHHKKQHQEEKQKHEQLPFHQGVSQQISSAFLIPAWERPDLKVKESCYRSLHFIYQAPVSFYTPRKLFQPPKFA